MTSQSTASDEYGFVRSSSFDGATHQAFMQSYLRVLSTRSRKWDKLLKKGYSRLERGSKLKRYIQKGIPGPHRPGVWMEVSGANALKKEEPDQYATMLDMHTDKVIYDQIKTDLPRTFPNNTHFDTTNPTSMQGPLLNVLKAFANANPAIGYCQGLNYIAGLLLLVTKNEENTYWLLRVLAEQILPDYYAPSMPGLLTDVRVLAEIARKEVPSVARHIDTMQMPWALICSKWFICIFSEVLPTETVLRVWDCLFAEGSKVLFRVSLAILKQNEKNYLTKRDFPELVDEFKRFLVGPEVVNCHSFIEKVYQSSTGLKRATLSKLRTELGNQVREEQMEREKRRAERGSTGIKEG